MVPRRGVCVRTVLVSCGFFYSRRTDNDKSAKSRNNPRWVSLQISFPRRGRFTAAFDRKTQKIGPLRTNTEESIYRLKNVVFVNGTSAAGLTQSSVPQLMVSAWRINPQLPLYELLWAHTRRKTWFCSLSDECSSPALCGRKRWENKTKQNKKKTFLRLYEFLY